MNHTLNEVHCDAKLLAETLQRANVQIVFAESCTGGLISAALTRVPGISAHLCGSAVVYQIPTKAAWLDVSETSLEDPGPVSAEVAIQMATGVLNRTPAADVAVSVTGHLGPDAPVSQDGLMFTAAAFRGQLKDDKDFETTVRKHWLSGPGEDDKAEVEAEPEDFDLRVDRQQEAASFVLQFANSVVTSIQQGVSP